MKKKKKKKQKEKEKEKERKRKRKRKRREETTERERERGSVRSMRATSIMNKCVRSVPSVVPGGPAAVAGVTARRGDRRRRLDRDSSSSSLCRSSSSSTSSLVVEEFRNDVLSPPMRIGHGFDLHRLEEGYDLIIGGLNIPHTRGCVAHSDGDVLLHCITDAVLGALCLEDIGQLFPDNDPKWKGAASDIFMIEAMRLCDEMGYRVSNLDATIIAQRPKLSPHKEMIRDNVSKLLRCDRRLVNLKAKTHEKVDSLGENRSIGCHCVVLLVKK